MKCELYADVLSTNSRFSIAPWGRRLKSPRDENDAYITNPWIDFTA